MEGERTIAMCSTGLSSSQTLVHAHVHKTWKGISPFVRNSAQTAVYKGTTSPMCPERAEGITTALHRSHTTKRKASLAGSKQEDPNSRGEKGGGGGRGRGGEEGRETEGREMRTGRGREGDGWRRGSEVRRGEGRMALTLQDIRI